MSSEGNSWQSATVYITTNFNNSSYGTDVVLHHVLLVTYITRTSGTVHLVLEYLWNVLVSKLILTFALTSTMLYIIYIEGVWDRMGEVLYNTSTSTQLAIPFLLSKRCTDNSAQSLIINAF